MFYYCNVREYILFQSVFQLCKFVNLYGKLRKIDDVAHSWLGPPLWFFLYKYDYGAFSIKNDFVFKMIDRQIKESHQECGKGDDGDGVPRKLPVRSVFV